jgi:hypothetical protein
MRGRRSSELLALPVRLHGIQLGQPVEVYVEPVAERVVGFEVLCGDDTQRFLPFSVVELHAREISLSSALTLIDERGLDFYRRRLRRLADLGYADPWIDDDGRVHEARSAA